MRTDIPYYRDRGVEGFYTQLSDSLWHLAFPRDGGHPERGQAAEMSRSAAIPMPFRHGL